MWVVIHVAIFISSVFLLKFSLCYLKDILNTYCMMCLHTTNKYTPSWHYQCTIRFIIHFTIEVKYTKFKFLLIFFCQKIKHTKINTYARVKSMYTICTNDERYFVWLTIIVCTHICQAYRTELPILLNPLLPSWKSNSDNSKYCNGHVNFKITRFNCIY